MQQRSPRGAHGGAVALEDVKKQARESGLPYQVCVRDVARGKVAQELDGGGEEGRTQPAGAQRRAVGLNPAHGGGDAHGLSVFAHLVRRLYPLADAVHDEVVGADGGGALLVGDAAGAQVAQKTDGEQADGLQEDEGVAEKADDGFDGARGGAQG